MIVQIASIIAPLFICAAIGFFWERFGPPFNTQAVTGLALVFGMPCLAFSTLTKLEASPEAFAQVSGAYIAALACFLILGLTVVRFMRLPASAYLPMFTTSNTGNMGLALSLFAFGEAGLALAISIFVISSIFSFTVGWSIYAGRLSADVLYNNPLIYAVAAAAIFIITGVRPPVWLANTTELLGGLTIPLVIIALGVSMSKLKVVDVRRAILLSLVKLGLGFAVGLGVAELFGMTGVARGVLIIGCSMPVAVHNYVFALKFERRPEETASVIVLSTAISMATLPLLLAFVLAGARAG